MATLGPRLGCITTVSRLYPLVQEDQTGLSSGCSTSDGSSGYGSQSTVLGETGYTDGGCRGRCIGGLSRGTGSINLRLWGRGKISMVFGVIIGVW